MRKILLLFRLLLKILVVVGLVLVTVSGYWYYRISHPQAWTLEEARQHIHSSRKQLVTIHARPEFGHKRYNTKANIVTQERPVLGTRAPEPGAQLVGPAAAHREEWNALVGEAVWTEAKLKVVRGPQEFGPKGLLQTPARLKSIHLMLPMQIPPNQFLRDRTPVNVRRILAYLGDNIWVLSDTFAASAGETSSTLREITGEVKWAQKGVYKGLLYRCKDYPFTQKEIGDFAAENRGFSDDWLIDEGNRVQFTQNTGYYVYLPMEGTERKIWIQVPLEESNFWETKIGDDLTGVWLPAEANSFVPDGPDAHPGETAVLQWGEWTRRRYIDDEAGGVWGPVCLGGIGLIVLSGLLLYITAP